VPPAELSGLSGSLGLSEAFHSSCGDWLFRNSAIGDFAAVLEQHMSLPLGSDGDHAFAPQTNP
jgi:hypothetical protein